MTDDPVEQALAELQDLVRCRCHPAYTGRGLHDPDCECDSAEAVKAVADRIEAQAAEIEWYRDRVVWGFYENETPKFYQGKEGEHEICEPVSAKEVTCYVNEIERLRGDLAKAVSVLEQAKVFIDDQYACSESQALNGEYVSKAARPIWNALCIALAELTGDNT